MHIEFGACGTIYSVTEQAIKKAKEINGEVTFDFNEIPVMRVSPGSDPNDIALIYHLRCRIRRMELGLEEQESSWIRSRY